MRITISHSKGQQEMIRIVDQAFDQAFQGLMPGPVTVTAQQKTWQGPVMNFSTLIRMVGSSIGFMPIFSNFGSVLDN